MSLTEDMAKKDISWVSPGKQKEEDHTDAVLVNVITITYET